MREEDLYELATDELNSRNRKADLWARACALATDDVDEARYLYTNLRVEELAIEHEVDLTQANQALPENLEDPDPTLALASQDVISSSQRIPDTDDESNLTPAQLALKRVNDSMGGDSTNQLPTGLSLQDDTATGKDQPGIDAGSALEFSLDDSMLETSGNGTVQASTDESQGKNTENKTTDNPAGLVLGDLITDNNALGDNTIHIDADSSVLDFEEEQATQAEQADIKDSHSTGSIITDELRPEEVSLANSSAFFAESSNAASDNAKQQPEAGNASESGESGQIALDGLVGGANQSAPEAVVGDPDVSVKKNSSSFADESLEAIMALAPAGVSSITTSGNKDLAEEAEELSLSASEGGQPATESATGTISEVTKDNPQSLDGLSTTDTPAARETQAADIINDSDFENFNPSNTDQLTPAVRKKPVTGLKQNNVDDENAGDLSDLIGSGREPIPEPDNVTTSTGLPTEEDAVSADEVGHADEINVAAMQDAGSGLAREFAIYQNASGVVSAIPKGTNLKAMLFTLPWLASRRLWSHCLVYLILLLVLLAAVITTATVVISQWPNVAMLDMGAALAFVLLALVGLFYLPYRFANSWQEEKIASKGFEYQSDQLAGTIQGAEQSYLLSAKNRIENFESESDFAKAA